MNINQNKVVLLNANGHRRVIGEIADLWHIAQYLSAKGRADASAAVLEVWHAAHDMKDAITELDQARIIEAES